MMKVQLLCEDKGRNLTQKFLGRKIKLWDLIKIVKLECERQFNFI